METQIELITELASEKAELQNNQPLPNAVQFCEQCKAESPDCMGYNVYCNTCAKRQTDKLDNFLV